MRLYSGFVLLLLSAVVWWCFAATLAGGAGAAAQPSVHVQAAVCSQLRHQLHERAHSRRVRGDVGGGARAAGVPGACALLAVVRAAADAAGARVIDFTVW